VAGRRCLLVADRIVAGLHGEAVASSLADVGIEVVSATFPAGEEHKNLATAERLWESCAEAGITRDAFVVAVGGGVTGDLAGFVAACWMRGVAFVQVPTTLLAMVDSAVGGKTGINAPAGKNLIGAFKQPACVIADPELLLTMDAREYRAGLAEVLKYGVIRDADFLAWQEAHADALAGREAETVAEAVRRSCTCKAAYVAEDETERGVRAHLNYGHTFGHALERDTGFRRYLHGEAVAIGMRMAARLAEDLGICEDDRLVARQDALIAAWELPSEHRDGDPDAAARRLAGHCRLDKKSRDGRARFVLPRRVGEVAIVDDVAEDDAAAAFRSAIRSD